jgi:Tol biopolymer transport system component
MNRIANILVCGALGLLGCEGPAPDRSGDERAVAAAGLSGAGIGSTDVGVQESPEVVVRRVWGQQGMGLSGDVSRDRRELVFVDYATGNLTVLDLGTRETRLITDKGGWAESGDYAMNAKLSRDGKNVAYTWATHEGNTERYELRVIGIDGRGVRTVYRDESVEWIQPLAWLPGGDRILASVIRKGGRRQVIETPVMDGESRILREVEFAFPGIMALSPMMALSPDGESLVYDKAQAEGSGNRDIFLMAVNGSGETLLVGHEADDFVLGWAPDGKHILFASDRQETLGAWLLPVEDGEPSGEPLLVRPDMWRMTPIGFAEDGSYYYGVSTTKRTVQMARLDPVTGNVLTPLYPVDQHAFGSRQDSHAFWSPDGRFMAYQSVQGPSGAERPAIMVQSMEAGDTREVSPRGVAYVAPRLWSRDGAFVLGFGRDEEDRKGLFRVSVLTGETQAFANFWGVDMRAPLGQSADEESFYYTVSLDEGIGIAARGLDGGSGETLWRGESLAADLSPDGRYLAIGQIQADSCSLVLLPTSGGEAEVLLRFPPGEGGPEQITWTPDGETIVYRNDREIWSIPRVGGTPRRLEWPIDSNLVVGMRNIEFSPDGARIAFDAVSGEVELWVMENFLPGPEDAQGGRRVP